VPPCVLLGILALLGLHIVSCSDSASPDPTGEPTVYFTPTSGSVVVPFEHSQILAVSLENARSYEIIFQRGDTVLSTGELQYVYQGSSVGADTVTVRVTLAGDRIYEHTWYIWVDGAQGDLPPVVPGLHLVHAPQPGGLTVLWDRPGDLVTPRPLVRYLVKASARQVRTEADWEVASLLEAVASTGAASYSRTYNAATSALEFGQQVWIAVRAEDVTGLLSPLGAVVGVRVTAPYRITGVVLDDAGVPFGYGEALVDWGCADCKTVTEADGSFVVPPLNQPVAFRDIDKYRLTIRDESLPSVGGFYDFVTDSLGVDTGPVEVVLITNYGLSPGCAGTEYEGEFLTFMRHITHTDTLTAVRPNQRLLKWDHYPISVYIEPGINVGSTTGLVFNLDELMGAAVAEWNERMGKDYFVLTEDEYAADLEVRFVPSLGPNFGLAEVIEPAIGTPHINEVIPERMRIRVVNYFNTVNFAHEVMLHELGHTLCVGGHSDCDGMYHLMDWNVAGMIDAWAPDIPISEDEFRLMRAIRNLPQGVAMNNYLLN
jgi:hypothetical protein